MHSSSNYSEIRGFWIPFNAQFFVPFCSCPLFIFEPFLSSSLLNTLQVFNTSVIIPSNLFLSNEHEANFLPSLHSYKHWQYLSFCCHFCTFPSSDSLSYNTLETLQNISMAYLQQLVSMANFFVQLSGLCHSALNALDATLSKWFQISLPFGSRSFSWSI